MTGPTVSERTSASSSGGGSPTALVADYTYVPRSRRRQSPPPLPQQGGDDAGMFKSDHMASPSAPKTSVGGKLLNRPSNRIASHSMSESTNHSSSSTSRSMASSALASLTRFHPLGLGSNQSSPASSTSTMSSHSTSTYYSHGNADSYSRSVSTKDKDRDDDADSTTRGGAAGGGSATASGAASNNSSNSSLPVLSTSSAQTLSSSSSISTSAPSSSTYHQRLYVSSTSREPSANSHSSVLPGPALASAESATKKNPKGLVGLQNLGNTCFMNSCLQCVSNLPAVVKYFQSGQYTKELNESSPTKGALATVFGDLIKTLWSNEQFTATRPVELKRVIGKVASRFTGYDQQDAQEFLRFLLDGLHEDLNRITKKPPYYEIKDREHAKDRDVSDEYWKFYLDRNTSALSELFCGQLRSEIRCSTCHHRSLCFDVFWDLSLPVPKKPKAAASHHMRIANVFGSKQSHHSASSSSPHSSSSESEQSTSPNSCSLQDCLKAYTDQELLTECDAYYCAKCKTHRAVAKKISLYRLPQVLVVHLKRFSYSTFSRDKVSTPIKFPAQGLDVAEFCAADAVVDGSTQYDLTGVVHHVGSLNGGHYTAECWNKDTQEWFDFNDASVAGVKKPQLCSSSAYILFFRRREEKSLTI